MQPPTGTRFTNSHIHGIRADHVTDGSTWADSAAAIASYVGDGPVIAYNSPFDKGVYSAACRESQIDVIDHVWRDARVAAKTHLVLDGYRLVDVARHLGLLKFEHHDAGQDAEACARVVLALAELASVSSLEGLWPVRTQTKRAYFRPLPLPPTDITADPEHPLFGASITFTGDLEGYTRDEARAAVAALGATVTAGPTRKTDVVVVGGFDPATLRPGTSLSSKLQKAYDLRSAGLRLELISEADLTALLAYESGR